MCATQWGSRRYSRLVGITFITSLESPGALGIVALPCIDTLSGALEPLEPCQRLLLLLHIGKLYNDIQTVFSLKRVGWKLKVSLPSVARFVVLFVLVHLVHFPSDNDQHPKDTFDLIIEKSPLEKHCL